MLDKRKEKGDKYKQKENSKYSREDNNLFACLPTFDFHHSTLKVNSNRLWICAIFLNVMHVDTSSNENDDYCHKERQRADTEQTR